MSMSVQQRQTTLRNERQKTFELSLRHQEEYRQARDKQLKSLSHSIPTAVACSPRSLFDCFEQGTYIAFIGAAGGLIQAVDNRHVKEGLLITTCFSAIALLFRKKMVEICEEKYVQRKLTHRYTFYVSDLKAFRYGLFGKSGITGKLDKLISLLFTIGGLLYCDTTKAFKHQAVTILFFTNSGLFYIFGKYCERRYTQSRATVKKQLAS